MTSAIRLFDAGEVSAVRSQALYHGIAQAMTESTPDTLVICAPSETCFCVGYHQMPEAELDLDFCRAHGYPVLHRRIGGGTVVLDSDQLFYQIVIHASRAPVRVDAIYRTFLAAPVAALKALGVPASLEGSNEIEVRGRRIAGTGGGRIGDAMVMTGNLLLDFPYDLMIAAWRTPTPAFRSLAGEALRRSVTTIRNELGYAPAMNGIRDLLVRSYRTTLERPLVDGPLTDIERAGVEAAEAALLEHAGEERVVQAGRALKIARGVYVRQGEDGPRLESS